MVFADLGISGWLAVPFIDVGVTVKSRQSLGKYDELKYFKENENALNEAENGVSFKKSGGNSRLLVAEMKARL